MYIHPKHSNKQVFVDYYPPLFAFSAVPFIFHVHSGKIFSSLIFYSSPSFPHQALVLYPQAFQYLASALISLHFYKFIVVTTLPMLCFLPLNNTVIYFILVIIIVSA